MSVNRIGSLLLAGVLGEGDPEAAPTYGVSFRQDLRRGDRVRVHCGVFAGVEGTVLRHGCVSRVVIAVDLDCQGVSLEIDEPMLERIDF